MSEMGLIEINDPLMEEIQKYYRIDETFIVEKLIEEAKFNSQQLVNVKQRAKKLVEGIRSRRVGVGGLDAFLHAYDLSSEEGIVLMCLAEALLRIPDNETRANLIKDKLSTANWEQHIGKSDSLFVNAATWGLMLTGNILKEEDASEPNMKQTLKRLTAKSGEPFIRKAVAQAMKILGKQFVMGRTIKEAIKRAKVNESKGYLYSYDMLGEAARTHKDATRYFEAYKLAIETISSVAKDKDPKQSPGISVKLSALHPRYEYSHFKELNTTLLPRIKILAQLSKQHNINFTIDAEESYRLEISLHLIEALMADPDLAGWDGLGLAVQSYQKRALFVIDWLIAKARKYNRKLMVRLVKGAYWDTEIKLSQEQGFTGYPVFTRKILTDVSFRACVKRLFSAPEVIFPQFATHNAMSLSSVLECANGKEFEFQCLHGMGETLYDQVVGEKNLNIPCRIYAPVGTHEDLLAYLVRRLLENGANTSFVNRIVDARLPIEQLIENPVSKAAKLILKPHPKIPLPNKLYGDYRENSLGLDLTDALNCKPVFEFIQNNKKVYIAHPTLQEELDETHKQAVTSPQDYRNIVGYNYFTKSENVSNYLKQAIEAQRIWSHVPVEVRANSLIKCAKLLEQHKAEFMYLAIQEAGKSIADSIGEVREAIDFCYYYANQAQKLFTNPVELPGPTGEINQLHYHGRGVFVCISPWNFPLAIFLGQVTAALVAGNAVIAKPAEQTSLIAQRAVELLYEAGVPKSALQLVPGQGKDIGQALISNPDIAGVMFTGSTQTAKHIQRTLAEKAGPIVPFIAETGGQNAMLVDSSALLEQVTDDVISSAFHSAGQRCSALRILCVQEDIADKLIEMIKGAMQTLTVGSPDSLLTDVGPVIDKVALTRLQNHESFLQQNAKLIYKCQIAASMNAKGYFCAPQAHEINKITDLKEEVFGPILHIVRYRLNELDSIIKQINDTGYGLTLGIHSRITNTVQNITQKVKVGNIYVNRNIIGAVVGVQPFGGEGLSGTGPKAGGPNYLLRLCAEKTVTINTTAQGGNASLMALAADEATDFIETN